MKIVDARHSSSGIFYEIFCDCGVRFSHPANQWTVKCLSCVRVSHLEHLRDEYFRANQSDQASEGEDTGSADMGGGREELGEDNPAGE